MLAQREAVARRAEDARNDLQRRHDDLQYAATHDALTGLLNRTGLDQLRESNEANARLSAEAREFLLTARGLSPYALGGVAVSTRALRELEAAHRALIAMHLEKDLKSVRVLRDMRR